MGDGVDLGRIGKAPGLVALERAGFPGALE
jgi:hypothetical protein